MLTMKKAVCGLTELNLHLKYAYLIYGCLKEFLHVE